MGSYPSKHKQHDNFSYIVKEIKRQKDRQSVMFVNARPDEKYRNHMLVALDDCDLAQIYKINLENVIRHQITKEEITSTIYMIALMKSNDISSEFFKNSTLGNQRRQCKNVVVKFSKELRTQKQKTDGKGLYLQGEHIENTLQGRITTCQYFFEKQLSKSYHPFPKLCSSFATLMADDESLEQKVTSESDYEKWEQQFRKLLQKFCNFLTDGCLRIYKKWMIAYTGVEEDKYNKWIYNLVLNLIWVARGSRVYQNTLMLISRHSVPLKINQVHLTSESLLGRMHPLTFYIDEELQIEGSYFTAIYELSELNSFRKPSDILKQLEKIKDSICIDVDNYHNLQEKGAVYQINSDNIMGIVAYLLCKMVKKIKEIYFQLLFLRLIYGDAIYFQMNESSYLYSTLSSGLEYLETLNTSTNSQSAVFSPTPQPVSNSTPQSMNGNCLSKNMAQCSPVIENRSQSVIESESVIESRHESVIENESKHVGSRKPESALLSRSKPVGKNNEEFVLGSKAQSLIEHKVSLANKQTVADREDPTIESPN